METQSQQVVVIPSITVTMELDTLATIMKILGEKVGTVMDWQCTMGGREYVAITANDFTDDQLVPDLEKNGIKLPVEVIEAYREGIENGLRDRTDLDEFGNAYK